MMMLFFSPFSWYNLTLDDSSASSKGNFSTTASVYESLLGVMKRYVIFEKDRTALDQLDGEEQLILDLYKDEIPRLLRKVS